MTTPIQVLDEQGRQRNAGDEAIGLLVSNISCLNNGAIEQIREFMARQPIEARSRLIERCASLIGSVAEISA